MYVIAIVMVGIILTFGYRSIMSFSDKAEQVALVKFQKNFGSSVKSISNQYGTFKKIDFMISNEFEEVCFLNNYNFNLGIPMGIILKDHR